MTDLRLSSENFASTEITVEPVSEAGKKFFAEMFGIACCSVTMRKSGGIEFAKFANEKGLRVA